MKRIFTSKHSLVTLSFLVASLFSFIAKAAPHQQDVAPGDTASLLGRWDMTIYKDGKTYPSWMDIYKSGFRTLVGEFVGIVGSSRPVSNYHFKDGTITFAVPPQWEQGSNDLSFTGTFSGDSLKGSMSSSDGKDYEWSAVKAPLLKRISSPSWGQPQKIFNGKDLTGWHALGNNQWTVKDGVLQSPHSGSNLITDDVFNDFKLHIEFRYPKESNSGVYLRGRYEVQIEENHTDEPYKDVFSGVYGFIAPSEIASLEAGQWQAYDITLVGRMVTIVANGKTVICNREIPGPTGGAINSREGEPGPLLIQGDHGPIEYRNIILTKAK